MGGVKTGPDKYTEEYIRAAVKELYADLMRDKTIIYIGQLFESKEYTRERFWEWGKKYSEDYEISNTIKAMKEILEARAVAGGMSGELNPTMTIFHLKNNYGYVDKNESIVRNVNTDISLDDLNDDDDILNMVKKKK